nr:unnamed protein product [Callosobruchus chinensis]
MKSSSITEEKTLKFNHSAKKELRRKLSSSHLKEHEKDINLTLNCHKLIYKERSRKYKRGAQVLSPDKPYCILYLGLLIIKDQVQLCDMLRFIKEGHLSYNNYNHLLQDEMSDKILGVQSHPKNMLLTHKGIRTATYKLAKFLGILHYVEVPDVVKLCDRFCREMNLPDQILEAVRTIISVTNPTFAIQKRDECLPNYEGRCMSIILFVIKLLFGMDGVTEYELSKFAKLLNEGGYKNKFFNIQEWLTHIQFRRLVIEQNHFPINYETDNSKISSDLYLQHIKSHNVIFDESAKLSNVMKNYKQLLERLREIQHDFITHLKFPPSLTPFHDYTRNITDIFGGKYHSNIKRDFKNDDLGFLKCSERFFEQLDEQIRVENGGGNYNIILEETKCRIITQPKSFYLVELIDDLRKEHKRIFKQRRNQHLLKEKKIKHKFEQGTSLNGDESYKIHYLPQKRYWLNTTVGRYDTACDYLKPFLKTYPSTFMQIFEECCRIIEQSQADLFQSFQSTELFLVYLVDFSGDNREHLVNKRLVHHINLALDCW